MIKNKIIASLFISFLLLLYSCNNSGSKTSDIVHDGMFKVFEDTITVSIKGEPTHALKHGNKYYVLFKQKLLNYGYPQRWVYILADGDVENIIDCSKEGKSVYLDFYNKNDSIILNPYMREESYYLDLNSYKWVEIKKDEDLIFEDEIFQVFSTDFGEWGGKTWFKEKATNQQYVTECTTPLVNKIDSTYYLTKLNKVIKIDNPRLLNKCSDDITYENIRKTKQAYRWYGEPIGYETVYQDTTYDYFEGVVNFKIVSSFVFNNELLHVYTENKSTYIAKHSRYSVEPIQKIENIHRFFNWVHSYRCRNLNGKNELLKFRTNSVNLWGLMDIIDNKIYIHYIKIDEELEPKTRTTSKADEISKNRIGLIASSLGSLKLQDIDAAEQKWESFENTPNHTMELDKSYYPNPNKHKLDTTKSYLIKEGKSIENQVSYYAAKENGQVHAALLRWESSLFGFLSGEANSEFKQKWFNFETLFEKILGKPYKEYKKSHYQKKFWKTPNEVYINLGATRNFSEITIFIYKD